MNLTKEHRKDITQKAITATFAKREAAYMKQRTALADALYQHAFGDMEKLANKMPPGWVHSISNVDIYSEGFARRYHNEPNKCPPALKLSKERRVPISIGDAFTVNAGHALHDQTTALLNEYEALQAAKDELESKLRGILAACTTLAKLMALWPEGKKFFPVEQPKQTAVVPYELALTVNKIMGITPAKSKG